MKNKFISTTLCICCITISMCLFSCGDKNKYILKGKFYVKTSPSEGDTNASEVIDIEAEYISYQGTGDIIVPVIVGFGHLPSLAKNDSKTNDTFYVLYQVFGFPIKDNPPVWKKKVEYADSFYDAKYNSTIPNNTSFLFIPISGEFYPLYKERVEIVFPEGIQEGRVEVYCYSVYENGNNIYIKDLDFSFTRDCNVLTLDS